MTNSTKAVVTSTHDDHAARASARAMSYRWVVLGVAVVAQTTGSVVTQGVSALIPFWQSAFDLSSAAAALAMSAVNIGPIASMLFLGGAIDRYGERRVVSLTMIAMGLTALAAAVMAPGYAGVLLFLALIGMWYAAIQPGGTRAIVRWFPTHLRGMAMGVRQAGLPLGGAIAAATLPMLALQFGWPAALYAQAAIGILGGVLFGLFYREGDRLQMGAEVARTPSILALVRTVVTQSTLRPVLAAGIAMVSLQYTFVAHLLVFLTRELHIAVVPAGFLLATTLGAGIAGRVLLAWISDHFWPGRRLRSLGWTMLASGLALAALIALPAQPAHAYLFLICAWLGLFGIGWYPLYLVQVAEMAPASAVASTVSFAMTLNQIAIVVMPPIFGLIVDVVGGYGLGWALLATLLVIATAQLRRYRAAISA